MTIEDRQGVTGPDYYSEALLDFLVPHLEQQSCSPESLLEIGCGRGFLSIMLAKRFPSLTRILSTDINPIAIRLTQKNTILNGLRERIQVAQGSLYEPVEQQSFDLIVSAPPQLPVTKQRLASLNPQIDYHHLTTSVGGFDGREIIDPLIQHAFRHLNSGGMICIVHADFIGGTKTLEQMKAFNLAPQLLGTRQKAVDNTSVTKSLRGDIETSGYQFQPSEQGDLFNLLVIAGKKSP